MSRLMNSMTKECKFHSLINKCLSAVSLNEFKKGSMICKEVVESVVKEYNGLVFSELDKNVNSWSVMCICRYRQMLKDNFSEKCAYYEKCVRHRLSYKNMCMDVNNASYK